MFKIYFNTTSNRGCNKRELVAESEDCETIKAKWREICEELKRIKTIDYIYMPSVKTPVFANGKDEWGLKFAWYSISMTI